MSLQLSRRAGARLTSQSHAVLRSSPVVRTQRRHASLQELDAAKGDRERVVILGSGWAGYNLARRLDTDIYQPIIVTPRTYFTFTPLLAGTATGTLEFRAALESSHALPGVRAIRGWANEVVVDKKVLRIEARMEEHTAPSRQAEVTRNINQSESITPALGKGEHMFQLDYDKLVIAVGCFSQTFNTPGVKENAFFLKDAADARRIRRRILDCVEEAALPTTTPERRKELLHFAIVGGGPTGIEFAAELHDLIEDDFSKINPELMKSAKITVYDVAPKILAMFDENLQRYATKHFSREGIQIKTQHHVERIDPDALVTKEEGRVPVGLVVWSTGLAANPFIAKGLEGSGLVRAPRGAQVEVDNHLRAYQADKDGKKIIRDDVFVLGDCAAIENQRLPATAQAANQMAGYLANALNTCGKKTQDQILAMDSKPVDISTYKPFKFKSLGIMAYLGSWKAIAALPGTDATGWAAWLIWRGAYLTKSLSWRNRIMIPVYWTVNWLLGRDINRF